MLKLIIDTSNRYLYLALIKNDEVIFNEKRLGNNNHSEKLIDVIDQVFKKFNLTADDIDQIYVGRGPGSYTGVRVACTVAKVLAFIKNKQLFSFNFFDLVLSNYLMVDGKYVAFVDARRGFCYAKVIEIKNKILTVIQDDIYISLEALKTNYPNFLFIQDEDAQYQIINLLNYQMFQAETNIHRFTPTYLRSGV